jgi:hypothetical protein
LNGFDFAEFDPRLDGEGEVGEVEFQAEDYHLRILEIGDVKVAESANSAEMLARIALEIAAIDGAVVVQRLASMRE